MCLIKIKPFFPRLFWNTNGDQRDNVATKYDYNGTLYYILHEQYIHNITQQQLQR